MAIDNNGCKVCVTGGSGYIGSCLVKKLLEKGYIVHATLRNLNEVSKVNLLKRLPGAETRLALFKADIYKPHEFENSIHGCECVFHVATPLHHTDESQYKNTTEATVAAVKCIARICERSPTVKRLIYTATVISASPLKDDGSGFKDIMDETCWTPLDIPIPYTNDFLKDYQDSKTLAEKEILGVVGDTRGKLEVVTLACGLVGGDESLLSITPVTVAMLISQLTTDNSFLYNSLKFMEELIGKIPIVHIDDVCEAHIFCMENSSTQGRFLCANSFISSQEIASFFKQNYPQLHLNKEYLLEGPKRKIEFDSSKLIEKGFTYKYDIKMILDGCISCAKRMGDLQIIERK